VRGCVACCAPPPPYCSPYRALYCSVLKGSRWLRIQHCFYLSIYLSSIYLSLLLLGRR
jgi:hypothetical protein